MPSGLPKPPSSLLILLLPVHTPIAASCSIAKGMSTELSPISARRYESIQVNPDLAGTYQGRGTARMGKSDLERAIADFGHALELDPKLATAYANRGLAWLLLDKDGEAQKDFEQCLLLKPDFRAELEKRI